MKKKNLKKLSLNKSAISNLKKVNGGANPTPTDPIPVDSGNWDCYNVLSIPKTKCNDSMCFPYSAIPGCTRIICP